jgi:hypothetical protein
LEIPEPKWAIPGILPEGLSILGAKPKHGKSMLALKGGLDISVGGKTLGQIDVDQGTVIYLALEDVNRRLQSRMKKMLSYDKSLATDKLHLFTKWPRMGDGGIKALEEEIKSHDDTRLVIIDTLAKFRPPEKGNKGIYNTDYSDVGRIKELADDCGVSILLIHHLRKAESEDPIDALTGSLGLSGAADGILILERITGQADAKLHITGRDVETKAYALRFEPSNLAWQMVGDASDVQTTDMKQRLFDAIKNHAFPISPKEIHDNSCVLDGSNALSLNYIYKTLPILLREGTIKKVEHGSYIYIGKDIQDVQEGKDVQGVQEGRNPAKLPTSDPKGQEGREGFFKNNNKPLQSILPVLPILPGDCKNCKACDQGAMQCHYKAMFEGKPDAGTPCQEARQSCPLKE